MDQKRYAFLMGANGPQSASFNSLKYAERDAQRLAAALKVSPCAFTNVEWMTAASRETALTKLKTFANQCESSDLLIVHFAGHGKYDEQLYLICNGTDITNLDASAIGIDAVKRILRKCKARHKVLVLDCCYAGGAVPGIFTRGEQDIKNVLSKELEGSTSIVLSACSRLEPARELEALDGGSGFLSWVLIASCTTRFRHASPDHCSLTLGDIWRWLPTALTEVNSLLGETKRLPSPILDSHLEAGADWEKIWLTEARREPTSKSGYEKPSHDRERFLKALVADHSSFMRGRLSSFVGRVQELKDIRQRIVEKQQTGGYVTITGQAGQGKSSIIAKLVEQYGPPSVAFHFIPFNPGPDHQVGLLRNLMARLILKYDLLDLYVASDSRPALRDYFPKVLEELAAKGGREVIFIDGLDQLEAETSGERDLSFLPDNPPTGVVFVLGTRPNDTLRPLKLLKPHNEYELPNLSREDFDLILGHRHVQLDKGLVDQLHQAMQGNALFLDLLAKELVERGTSSPEALIKQLAHNPEHLFSLTIARLKRQSIEWREVIKPVLGVLLVARESLGLRHIRQIIGVDDDRLRDGIERLGGLVTRDWQQRYSLFHLKLYEYLRQDEGCPTKEYIFATDEEQGWHKRLAQCCEGSDISTIWKDVKRDEIEQHRRKYARQHYLAHLYEAREWHQLFEVLDTVEYGKAKIQDDPSTRAYAHDLRLGQQAATWEGWTVEEGIALLPGLWQYTLLRSSLVSRADQYPLVAFRLLVLLKRKQQALELAELLTDPAKKVSALLQIAEQIREQLNQEREWLALLFRACEVARTIEDSYRRAWTLKDLGTVFAQAQQWEQALAVWREAQAVIATIEDSYQRAWVLRDLGTVFAQAQQWEQALAVWREAQAVIATIEDSSTRAEALGNLGMAFAQAQQWEQALAIWEQALAIITTLEDNYGRAWASMGLGTAFAQAQQWEQALAIITTLKDSYSRAEDLGNLGMAFAQAQQWEQALAVIAMIEDSSIENRRTRAETLGNLGMAFAQAQQWEQALAVWREAQAVVATIEDSYQRAEALRDLGTALAQTQHWEQALAVITMIEDSYQRAETLRELGTAFAQAQQWEQALAIIAMTENSSTRAWVLRGLGAAFAQAQQWEQALAVWRETQAVIATIEDSYQRVEALRDLGTAFAQAQQWEQALAVWREAQAVIAMIEDSSTRAWALGNLGTAFAQAQQWEQALAVIATIEDSSIENRRTRAEALGNLGMAFAQAQQWEQALAVWREAQAVVATIEDSYQRAWVLRDLGTVFAQAQQWEQALAIIATIEDSYERAWALRDLGAAFAQAQQWEQALAVWEQALAIFTAENSYRRAEVLKDLGTAFAQAQQWEQALATWGEAQAVIDTLEGSTRAEALRVLATALAQAQQWEQALAVIVSIKDSSERAKALKRLAAALASSGEQEQLLGLIQRSWLRVSTREEALRLFPLATELIPNNPELGLALYKAFSWVDTFLKG